MSDATNSARQHAGESLDAARERVAAAYDPEFFHKAGNRLIAALSRHLGEVQNGHGPVLNWNAPDVNSIEARRLLDESRDETDPAVRFERLVNAILTRGQNLHHPRYIGHQVPASVPLAALFDAVGSVTNQVMAIYEMGPWASAVESVMVEEFGRRIGWKPGTFSGVVTHGGSLANLTALLTARNVCFENSWEEGISSAHQPVLLTHAEAHYGIARSAGMLGIGTRNVVRVPLDPRRRMDAAALDRLLSELRSGQRPVIAVCANACATPIGAFDPLQDIADVCERHGVWLHVDAAHGGAALLSRRHRHLLDGLERADSVVWDAHKMMFVPALCAFVLYRDRKHRFETFRQDAPYLFDPSAPGMAEHDSGMRTIECTKRAAAYGIWGLWSMFGPELFESLVDLTFDLAQTLHSLLAEAADFQVLHEPQCNIVAFRHLPAGFAEADSAAVGRLQHSIRRRLIESGEFYIVQTTVDGLAALRATVINPLTTDRDLHCLLDRIRSIGAMLSSC